ncbi:MAG: hypothetical protein J6X65_05170 [Bacteroidales bacterium]|nr:hypothetical protein [Bacteroidales bacterium]
MVRKEGFENPPKIAGDLGISGIKIAGDLGILRIKIAGDLGISEIKIAGDLFFLKLSICKSEKKAVILFCHNLMKQQTDIS